MSPRTLHTRTTRGAASSAKTKPRPATPTTINAPEVTPS